MKIIPILAAAGILAACLSPTSASARDPYDADWSGDCRPDVECLIKIRPAGKRLYRLDYVAIGKTGPRRVLCHSTGFLRPSKTVLGALSGTFGPGQLQRIDVIRDSKVDAIHVTPSDNTPCGRPLAVGGQYLLLAH